jgi:hypothetical protein
MLGKAQFAPQTSCGNPQFATTQGARLPQDVSLKQLMQACD